MPELEKCRVCQSDDLSEPFVAREMMYGTRESFDYRECRACGTVQIDAIPGDLGRFYPEDYYSMSAAPIGGMIAAVKEMLLRQRDRHALGLANLLGRVVARSRPAPAELAALAIVAPRQSSRILDVGCGGTAHFLRRLAGIGFSNLTGADPFIDRARIRYGPVTVLRAMLAELEGPYDVVTLNHSFEHFPEPRAALADVARILAPGGACVLRIPTPSSEAFSRYRADWVQLDAPRHLNLPSRNGVAVLAEMAGFSLEHVVDDSNAFQFTGSELYRRDIALFAPEATTGHDDRAAARFSMLAAQLNEEHRGDQAAFILKKQIA